MLVLIRGHNTRAAVHLTSKSVLLHRVSRQLTTVILAPIVKLFIEIQNVKLVEQSIPAVAEWVSRLILIKYINKIFTDIVVSVLFLVRLMRHTGVGRRPTVILRLVCEKTHELLSEAILESLVILFVSLGDKCVNHLGIENICIRGARANIHAVVFAHVFLLCPEKRVPAIGLFVNGVCRVVIRILHLILKELREKALVLQKLSANESAGPTVLIIYPRIHTKLSCLFKTRPNTGKPLLAKVFGGKSQARVYNKATDIRRLHFLYLLYKLTLVKLVIPAPERNGLIISSHTLFYLCF